MKKITCLFTMLFASISVAVAEEADTRSVIQLSSQHRALVLTEMRQFLSGLQQMTDALSRDDMETVTREARTLGTSMSHHMPADLKQALPQGFRKMGQGRRGNPFGWSEKIRIPASCRCENPAAECHSTAARLWNKDSR